MSKISTMGKIGSVAVICILVGMCCGYVVSIETIPAKTSSDYNGIENPVILAPTSSSECSWKGLPDQGWDHEASTLIDVCGTVTGKVVMITMYVENEADRYHFTVLPDSQYTGLLNDYNRKPVTQHGLDGIIMCEVPLDQVRIMPRLHVGQHLEIQGPYITDNENLWNEIHFVQSIKEKR